MQNHSIFKNFPNKTEFNRRKEFISEPNIFSFRGWDYSPNDNELDHNFSFVKSSNKWNLFQYFICQFIKYILQYTIIKTFWIICYSSIFHLLFLHLKYRIYLHPLSHQPQNCLQIFIHLKTLFFPSHVFYPNLVHLHMMPNNHLHY